MIRGLVSNSFGQWLRAARLETIDETTGRPYTQARLAELMNISDSKVAAWESGQIQTISPEDGRMISRILRRPEVELVEAMGWDVGNAGLTDDERRLLAAFRRLRDVPILQQGALASLEGMPAALGPLSERPTRSRRRSA